MEEVQETGAQSPAMVPQPLNEPKTFDDMQLRPEVRRAVDEMGFLDPMPVQSAVFARMMASRDVMVQARTGSGKTAAFAIPFAQGLVNPEEKKVQALVLAPTRELALQVAQECGKIGQYRELQVVPIYGGAPMGKQVDALKAGAQIVAGTPGRVLDHLRRGTLKLDGLKVLVLDEADEMLSMGFLEEITDIIKQCPTDRQTTLFSATIPDDIERIGSRYMRAPEKVTLSADGIAAREITHSYYMVSGMNRGRDLLRVLAVERPESAIIFCNTREETNYVAEFLKKHGLDAEAISSDLTQKDRERVMGRTKEKNLHYLVATDIAARGIDISDLSHVINYTFPESAEVYVHRTGRTGRAGKSGTAISLIAPRELGNFYMLKLTYKIKPEERQLPAEDQWKTVKEAERVEELKAALGERSVSDEWIAVARRLWASDGGEKAVALLVQDRLTGRGAAPDPQAAAIPAPREERPRERSRSRHDDGGRSGRKDESRGRRGRTREESRRHQRAEAGGAPTAPAKTRIAETIDTSDGREFWEAWVDSKSDAPSSAAGESAATNPPPAEPRPRREREPEEPLQPGQIRLYLNLGRRDGLKEPEVRALLAEKNVTVDAVQVRNSHTYLIVDESREAEVCGALTGGMHGDRQIVCEKAKR